jgi:hypothetical protein
MVSLMLEPSERVCIPIHSLNLARFIELVLSRGGGLSIKHSFNVYNIGLEGSGRGELLGEFGHNRGLLCCIKHLEECIVEDFFVRADNEAKIW